VTADDSLRAPAVAGWRRHPAADLTSRPGHEAVSTIGSHWRLTSDAQIVVRTGTDATLALCPPNVTRDADWLEAGTILHLVGVYDALAHAEGDGMDVTSFYAHYDGSSSRTYEIETGPRAGTRITLPTDVVSRYPSYAVFAHTALEPVVRER
jgi:hypothetical protein